MPQLLTELTAGLTVVSSTRAFQPRRTTGVLQTALVPERASFWEWDVFVLGDDASEQVLARLRRRASATAPLEIEQPLAALPSRTVRAVTLEVDGRSLAAWVAADPFDVRTTQVALMCFEDPPTSITLDDAERIMGLSLDPALRDALRGAEDLAATSGNRLGATAALAFSPGETSATPHEIAEALRRSSYHITEEGSAFGPARWVRDGTSPPMVADVSERTIVFSFASEATAP